MNIRRLNALWLLITLSCSQAPKQTGCSVRQFTDDLGRQVALPGKVNRIVSFAPSLTEMIFSIGAEERLAGVTSWCDFPPQARSKPAVGDISSPNFERMVALKPDLVVMIGNRPGPVLQRLEALGLPVLVFRDESLGDISRAITALGWLLDQGQQADSLNSALTRQLDSVEALTRQIDPRNRPRVFAEIAANPLFSAGHKSFLGQMIAAAGGVNITADLEEYYAAVNPEIVAERDPDIILILHPGSSSSQVCQRMGWQEIKAVRSKRVYDSLDQDMVLRPGPRFVEGLKLLHQAFYLDNSLNLKNKIH
jgi:iron complex transport system substrate-binding protein